MKKITIFIVAIMFIVCSVFIGATSYYIGVKTPTKIDLNTEQIDISAISDEQREEIKNEVRDEIKDEIREEVRQELYNEVYAEVSERVEENIKTRIEELETEEAEKTKELEQSKSTSNSNSSSSSTKVSSAPVASKGTPYIKVHNVSASASGGNDAIAAALRSAVDGSSGTVQGNADAVTGIGTFPVYWTATDGATATSYITITE